MLWNAVDPEPIESGVFYPFNGLALRVRATIESESEEKQMLISLRIVDPTLFYSEWSLNLRFDSKMFSDQYASKPFSKQFLQKYYFICFMRVLGALILRQNI